MKNLLIYSILCCILLLPQGCTNKATDSKLTEQSWADSVYTVNTILMTYGYNPKRALVMVDSAKLLGNINDYEEQYLRAQIYSNTTNGQHLDSAMFIAESLLEHDSVINNPDQRENILDILISVSRKRKDDERYLLWTTQKAQTCRETGQMTEALRMDAEIGLVLTHLGRQEEGIALLDATIQKLDTKNSVDRLDAFVIAVKRKITAMQEAGRTADIIPLGELIISRTTDFVQHPKQYKEDSYRLPPNNKDRLRYIDFTLAQANGHIAVAYATLGNIEKARHYLSQIEQSDYGKTLSAKKMLIPVYYAVGDHEKMLQYFEEIEHLMGSDTINIYYIKDLQYRALLADKQHQYQEASNYWKRYANLDHQLADSLLKSEAQKYAAQYHHQEQKMELEHQETVIYHMQIIILAIFIIALLAISFGIYIFRQKKILNIKNRILVKQIQEAIRFKHEYENLIKTDTPPTNHSKRRESPKEGNSEENDLEQMPYQELYNYISKIIIKERLFLDPKFDRQKVIERFNISEKAVGAAFSKGSEYKSLPGFVREQRLLYSCKLLVERPDLTINEICYVSGFSNHPRFSIDFKNRFSLSPTEYRLISSNEQKSEDSNLPEDNVTAN